MRAMRLSADLPADGYSRKVAQEVQRTIQPLPERVLLTGGNATPEAAASLASALGVGVGVLHPGDGMPEESGRRGLIAVGLAVSALAPAASVVNLRRGEFRYRPGLEKLRGPLAFMLTAWVLCAAILGAMLETRVGRQEDLITQAAGRHAALWAAVSDGPPPDDLLGWLDVEVRRAEGRSREAGTTGAFSALGMLRDVMAAVPADAGAQVRSVDVSPKRVRVGMSAASHTVASRVAGGVSEGTGLAFSPKNLRYEDGRSLFELECALAKEGSHAR